jgi:hypothetical protein
MLCTLSENVVGKRLRRKRTAVEGVVDTGDVCLFVEDFCCCWFIFSLRIYTVVGLYLVYVY